MLTKNRGNSATYFAGYMTTLSFLEDFNETLIKLHIIMYISMNVKNIDFDKYRCTNYRVIGPDLPTDRPRSGRPKKTSAADDRCIVVTSRRNRFMSALKLTEQFHATSGIRVSRRGRRPYRGNILTVNHARARLNWVTAHHRWTINEWNKMFVIK